MKTINSETKEPQIRPVSKIVKFLESQKLLWGSIIFGIVIIIISIVLFGCNRIYFDWKSQIDNGLLGTYGDFIGGTVGVILTFVGTILLYRTLKNQIASNEQTIRANGKQVNASRRANDLTSLQIFDSNFQLLFAQYRKAVESYQDESGKTIELRSIYRDFYDQNDPLNQEWTRRSLDAVQKFEDTYTKYREHMSVHFRMLYLIYKMIYESAPNESKVMYAKMVRGQMTDSELLFLRYNCMTPAGKKMQMYVNKYNLIKHLPFMEMLEAKKHKEIINNGELSNAINILVVSIKKWLASDFYTKEDFKNTHNISDNTSITFETAEKHHVLNLTLNFPNPIKVGGGMKRPAIERALVILNDEQLKDFGIDMIQEIMRYSNFIQYSQQEGSIIPAVTNTKGIQSLCLTYRSATEIFMTQSQKDSEPR